MLIDEIYEHIDENDKVLGIYLDLQKALDTIDHHIFSYFIRHSKMNNITVP